MSLSPEGDDFRAFASGIYDKVRNESRFNAGLPRARTQLYDRVRSASLGLGLK